MRLHLKTQPFSKPELIYGNISMDKTSFNKIDGFEKKSIEDSLKSMNYGKIFIPPGLKPTMVFPQFNGGTDWGGAAYDINDRMIYVNCSNEAEWFAMINLVEDKKYLFTIMENNYLKQIVQLATVIQIRGLKASINNLSVADKDRIKNQSIMEKGLCLHLKI